MDTGEELLSAWLELTVNVRGNRHLKELSLNECMALRAILREGGEDGLTATKVGERLRLLKSQTHNVLKGLEERGLVERRRGERDQRTVRIAATQLGREVYAREHRQVMELIRAVEKDLGAEDSQRLTELIFKAISAAEDAARRK